MKLLNVLLSASALFMCVSANVSGDEATKVNFFVDYKIKEFPDISNTDVAELTNEHITTLEYTVTNNDQIEISLVGVGGAFRDTNSYEIRTNLSVGSINPVTLNPGDSHSFDQKIELNLLPDSYLLTPVVYVVIDGELKQIQARGQLTTVDDVPISLFNPQLLVLEALLLVSFAGLGYAAYSIWGGSLLDSSSSLKSQKTKSSSKAKTTGSKPIDESWIPESHLKQKKSKKAY